MKAQRRVEYNHTLSLNLVLNEGWEVNATPRRFTTGNDRALLV